MYFVVNGQSREFPQLTPGAQIRDLIAELGLKGDRLAIEQNGNIVPRSEWGIPPWLTVTGWRLCTLSAAGSSSKTHPQRDLDCDPSEQIGVRSKRNQSGYPKLALMGAHRTLLVVA